MKNGPIKDPPDDRFIIIREWQIQATGSPCAAALLSFFEYWHKVKTDMNEKARHANAVARKHGDTETQDTSLYQFHTSEELETGIMGLYSRDKIREAIKVLEKLGFLTTHKNPNPRYSFDATKFFMLHPDVVNEWLDTRYVAKAFARTSISGAESRNRVTETRQSVAGNRQAIPENTSKKTTETSSKEEDISLDSEFLDFEEAQSLPSAPDPKLSSSVKPKMPKITVQEIYAAYPKKLGKEDAFRAIKKSMIEKDGEYLLEAVRAYAVATKNTERRFIKHPATWFNAGCYDDDRAEWNPPAPKSRAELSGKFVEKPLDQKDYTILDF